LVTAIYFKGAILEDLHFLPIAEQLFPSATDDGLLANAARFLRIRNGLSSELNEHLYDVR
jgi:hypothetical protein